MIPVDTLVKEALELPADARTELVDRLLRSLPALAPTQPSPPMAHDADTPITWEGAQGMLED